MTRPTISALAGAAALTLAPIGASAQDQAWTSDYGQQYGEEAYGFDLRGPYYAPDQERNRYGQNLSYGPEQGWTEPSFGADSRPPFNYYGPEFRQEPRGQYYQNRPSPPGVGGQQLAGLPQDGQQMPSGGRNGAAGQPDVLFFNPVTGRTTAFWVEDGGSQQEADRRYGAWREQQISAMDRTYEAWRADQIAEMDRNYEAWRRQQISQIDGRYAQDRAQAMAEADRSYEQTRVDEVRQSRRQYRQSLND